MRPIEMADSIGKVCARKGQSIGEDGEGTYETF